MKPWIPRLAVPAVLLIACGTTVLASANGLPHLDPTNGGAGTVYDVVVTGASLPMDPTESPDAFTTIAIMTITQDAGSSELSAIFELDTDGDHQPDRTLACEGQVGNFRFGLGCIDSDGLGEIKFVIAGKAQTLSTGKLALRKATGRGFTEDGTFTLAMRATQQ